MSSGNAANLERALRAFGFKSADAALFLEAGNIVRMGVPPIRIEMLTTISGADFDTCFEERILVTWMG